MSESAEGSSQPVPEWDVDSDIELAPVGSLKAQDIRKLANEYGMALRYYMLEPNTRKVDLLDRVRGTRSAYDIRSYNEARTVTLGEVLVMVGQEGVVNKINERAEKDINDPSIRQKLKQIDEAGGLKIIDDLVNQLSPNQQGR